MTAAEALQKLDPDEAAQAFQVGKDGGLTWEEALQTIRDQEAELRQLRAQLEEGMVQL